MNATTHTANPALNRNHYGHKPQYWYFRSSGVMSKYYANEKLTIDDKINIRSMNILPVHFFSNTAITFELSEGKLRESYRGRWAF